MPNEICLKTYSITRINAKWIQDLNAKNKTRTLLKGNMLNSFIICSGESLSNHDSKAGSNKKKKNNKFKYIKNFLMSNKIAP